MVPDSKGGFRNRAIPFLRAHFTPASAGNFRQEVSYYGAAVRDAGCAIANVGYAALRLGVASCRLVATGTGIALKSMHAVATKTRTGSHIISYAAFATAIPLGLGMLRDDTEQDYQHIVTDGIGALVLYFIGYATGPGSVGHRQVEPARQIPLRQSILRQAFPIRCVSYLKDPNDPHAWRWLIARFLGTGSTVIGSYFYLNGYQAVARKWSESGGSLLSYAADRSSGVFRPYYAESLSFWEYVKAWVSNFSLVCVHDGIPVMVSMAVDYLTMSAWTHAHDQPLPERPTALAVAGGLVPMVTGTFVSHVVVSLIARNTRFGDNRLARMTGHLLRLASRSGARYMLNRSTVSSITDHLSTADEHISLIMDFASAGAMHRWGTTTAQQFVDGLMMSNPDTAPPPAPIEFKSLEHKGTPSPGKRTKGQHFTIKDQARDVTITAETTRDIVIIDVLNSPLRYDNLAHG